MKRYSKFLLIASSIALLSLAACNSNNTPTENQNPPEELTAPYVGEAHTTFAIVNALPLPVYNWSINSISIGEYHGVFANNYSPYTLTIYYDIYDPIIMDIPQSIHDIFSENATALFDSIDNLQAITFFVSSQGSYHAPPQAFLWNITRYGEHSFEWLQ